MNIHHIGGIHGLGPVERLKGLNASWTYYDAEESSLNELTEQNCKLIHKAIWDKEGEFDFYVMSDPAASSLFKPHPKGQTMEFKTGDKWANHTQIVKTTKLKTYRLDNLINSGEVSKPDVLSVDAQAADLGIIQSLGEYLKDVLCVICEVEFQPLYEGQPLAHEVSKFMYDNGFRLLSGFNLQRMSGFDMVAEFVFIRETKGLNEQQLNNLKDIAELMRSDK